MIIQSQTLQTLHQILHGQTAYHLRFAGFAGFTGFESLLRGRVSARAHMRRGQLGETTLLTLQTQQRPAQAPFSNPHPNPARSTSGAG